MRSHLLSVVLVGPLAFGAVMASSVAAEAATTSLTAHARGVDEVPKPGPPGATATAAFTIDTGSGEICYEITSSGLDGPFTGAHIHAGAAGVAGPHAVDLDPAQVNSGAQACLTTSPSVAASIVADPASYYVNLHTGDFPAGGARGQLTLAPNGVNAGSGGRAADGSSGRRRPLLVMLTGAVLIAFTGRRLRRR